MSEPNDKKLEELLRSAIPPVKHAELERDLWPAMLRRLEPRPIRVSWWDWALAAGAAAWFLVFPEAIPLLLYQL